MKEIIIDHHTFTHLKKEIGDNLTGTGKEKPESYFYGITYGTEDYDPNDPNEQRQINDKKLLVKGKVIIQTPLSLMEYKNLVEDTYNQLKFIRKFNPEYIKKQINVAIYPYHFDPSLVKRTDKEILERKKWLEEVEMYDGEVTFSDLSHNNNNYTGFDIYLEDEEIKFARRTGFEAPPLINIGNIELSGFTSKSISHINIKKLPYKFKENLDIHPSLYKKTQKKELIDARMREYFWRYSSLFPISDRGDRVDRTTFLWDENDRDYLEYIEKGNKLIQSFKEKPIGYYGYLIKELNHRMTMDSINEHLVMMEVYIKSVESLRMENKEEIEKYSEEQRKEYNDFITKYKNVEELMPLFPITIFVQKRRVEMMKKSHPHLFDTGKESLSYFE